MTVNRTIVREKILGEQMERVLPFFYGLVYAGLSFIGVTRLMSFVSKKRHDARVRIEKAHQEYVSIRRPSIDDSFIEEWDQLQVYAQWLRDRMANRTNMTGRRIKGVTDEEIRELIKNCNKFSKSVNKAVCNEHSIIKKLPSSDGIMITRDEHNEWHWMFHGARRIKSEFKNLLKNNARPTV